MDLRVAYRSLRQFPLAAAIATISLAAAIGATTATLLARDVVFKRFPPLYVEPQQLSRVQVGSPERPFGSAVPAGLGIGIALTYGLARMVRAGGGAGSLYDPPV